MTRPVCYVYNGAICCASECPGLRQIANQLRGSLTVCPNGPQLVSEAQHCNYSNHCLRDFYIQNCSSEKTCQDEDSNQYFEGATWSVGKCIECRCVQCKIQCSRKLRRLVKTRTRINTLREPRGLLVNVLSADAFKAKFSAQESLY
ncbi:uncharacterized protein LOC110042360 [Orbicella faveolata]|uniref:uncharacterized protein LOC110042360 n=1 Tax=Orbicella faveolata TaxID=48498 RepID=UPI0009E4F754|nr:uncharacterized protein LOC110042360 [Orbicella faveolata]